LKLKFVLASLTSCSGCISTLFSLDIFPQFLERTKIVSFPFLSDVKSIEDCDIALIEGCISEKYQIDQLNTIRKHAKRVYALGTCAAFGGILSLSKKKKVEPIFKFIEIDGIIPGCPPPSIIFGNCLMNLIENKPIKLSEKNMCFKCPIKGEMDSNLKTSITKMYPVNDQDYLSGDNSTCFLKQGILCLGPVTREGCDHRCINQGLPCEGCLGPIAKDFTSNLINFLSLMNLSNDLKKYRGIFYRFSKPKILR